MICVGNTDVGKKRKYNQDAFCVENTDGYSFAVVCDGMGGAQGGSVASALAADIFTKCLHDSVEALERVPTSGDLRRIMVNALEEANSAIFDLASEQNEFEGMGTTLVSFLDMKKGKTVVMNVGDSRLYALIDGKLTLVTHDHSFVQFLIDSGTLTPEEAKNHPNKNIILRAVGINESAESDIFFTHGYQMLMLCTDGIVNTLTEDEITKILCKRKTLKEKCKNLIDLANKKNSADNITVVLYGDN